MSDILISMATGLVITFIILGWIGLMWLFVTGVRDTILIWRSDRRVRAKTKCGSHR